VSVHPTQASLMLQTLLDILDQRCHVQYRLLIAWCFQAVQFARLQLMAEAGARRFYQHVPGSSNWAWRMCWAHASSEDLVHWWHEPIALRPTPGELVTYDGLPGRSWSAWHLAWRPPLAPSQSSPNPCGQRPQCLPFLVPVAFVCTL